MLLMPQLANNGIRRHMSQIRSGYLGPIPLNPPGNTMREVNAAIYTSQAGSQVSERQGWHSNVSRMLQPHCLSGMTGPSPPHPRLGPLRWLELRKLLSWGGWGAVPPWEGLEIRTDKIKLPALSSGTSLNIMITGMGF